MAFPFPLNPINGQSVTYTNSRGRHMVATYSSVKNEWEVETRLPPDHNITSTPEFNVLPTADGQSVVWDDAQKKWVAKLLTYKTQDLTDVSTTKLPTADQILKWNDGTKQYEPAEMPGSDVWQATSNQVGGQTGATDALKVAQLYLALNPGKAAKEGEVILVSKGINPLFDGLVGSWFFDGTDWVLGASGGSTSAPKPTINYRGSTTDPQEPGVLAGDLDVVTEANNKQVNVYDGANYQRVLGELEIKQWIAAGSLFQGAIDSVAGLTALPAPDLNNKGFYWTWTGPASTNVSPADFPNGGGFATVLQVGDWIQSDGTKFIHVPSDLLSKLRWESVGSFKRWANTSWESDSLVTYDGKYYRAQQAIVAGDDPPWQAGSKWSDITPTYRLEEITDVNTAGTSSTHQTYLAYNKLDTEWQAQEITLDSLSNVHAATQANGAALQNDDVLFYDTTDSVWRVTTPKALAKTGVEIGDLKSVTLTGLADQHFLVYDGTTSTWKNTPTVRASLDFLADVGDVEINAAPEVGQGLAWTGNKWVPQRFGGMDEWKATASYAQNALVLYKNSIWLATASIPAGLEPGTTLASSSVTVGVPRSTGTFGTTIPGSTNLDTFDGVFPLTWNNGDYLSYTIDAGDLPHTVTSGIFAGRVLTEATGRVYVVDKANGLLATKGWYIDQGPTFSNPVQVNQGGFITNPWKKELHIKMHSLEDVDVSTLPLDGQSLVWNAATQKWVPSSLTSPIIYLGAGAWNQADVASAAQNYGMAATTIPDPKVWAPQPGDQYIDTLTGNITVFTDASGGTNRGTGGRADPSTITGGVSTVDFVATVLDEMGDVTITSPSNGQSLVYQNGQWVNTTPTVVSQTTIGDIKTSILTETQFKAQMGQDGGGWVLADGRNVAGSRYAQITGRNTLPDLRGAYLRMAGQNNNASWNGGTLNDYQEDTTRRPRNSAFTTDTQGNHYHSWTDQTWGFDSGGKLGVLGGDPNTPWGRTTSWAGNHTHTINGGGDTETRPKTYSVNYFIKIN